MNHKGNYNSVFYVDIEILNAPCFLKINYSHQSCRLLSIRDLVRG